MRKYNYNIVLKVAEFFGSVLFDVLEGANIDEAIQNAPVDASIKEQFENAIKSKGLGSFETIRNFGPSCGVEGGFEGALHLLISHDSYKEALIANAKAGGDSSARGMIVAMIMGAAGKEIVKSWRDGTKNI